ncbi:CTLH/CRA C-terminal to lish motif domain-containing protein [Halteromyces radiatus]|uniref:CTLH/CRA C-terminal to lish motif domain-containing protein n=1 Tax=Halteromyces radiatus TaxID=101107 RepID=UPI002220190D|nr:CTLH/CRA C-terminal to lish motif domain-containing protein [Halteromyces radiatus]KAI8093015.1 CTLH/CRA C-terminal to lish motif domain-containing protein [Halteromyces radiatus]
MDPSDDTSCRDIIMEYLMHSCYKNTAKAFQNEYKKQSQYSHLLLPLSSHKPDEMDIDQVDFNLNNDTILIKDEQAWNLLDARKDLYDAIERGDIPKAFDLIQQRFPGLLRNNPLASNNNNDDSNDMNANGVISKLEDQETERIGRVLFKLRCQQFIEIVRSSTEVEAIRYAQQYLRPMHKEYQDMITEVASLIAYADPEKSNQAHLLSQDRRRQLADEVNCVVLAHCKMPEHTAIERLQQQYELVQQELQLSKKANDKTSNRDKLSM